MFVFPRLGCHKNTQVGEREGVLSAVMTEQLVPFVREEKLLLVTLTHLAFGRKHVCFSDRSPNRVCLQLHAPAPLVPFTCDEYREQRGSWETSWFDSPIFGCF